MQSTWNSWKVSKWFHEYLRHLTRVKDRSKVQKKIQIWPIELIVTYAGMSRLRGFEKLGNVTRVISDSTFDISSHFSTAPQNRDTGKVLMQKHILTGPSLELYQNKKARQYSWAKQFSTTISTSYTWPVHACQSMACPLILERGFICCEYLHPSEWQIRSQSLFFNQMNTPRPPWFIANLLQEC